jgi:hypothetical protein
MFSSSNLIVSNLVVVQILLALLVVVISQKLSPVGAKVVAA